MQIDHFYRARRKGHLDRRLRHRVSLYRRNNSSREHVRVPGRVPRRTKSDLFLEIRLSAWTETVRGSTFVRDSKFINHPRRVLFVSIVWFRNVKGKKKKKNLKRIYKLLIRKELAVRMRVFDGGLRQLCPTVRFENSHVISSLYQRRESRMQRVPRIGGSVSYHARQRRQIPYVRGNLAYTPAYTRALSYVCVCVFACILVEKRERAYEDLEPTTGLWV